MEKGPRVQNTKTARFLSLQIIGKANILLLQNNNNKLLIHRIILRELYIINMLITKKNYCLITSKKKKTCTRGKSSTRDQRASPTGKTPEKPERLGISKTLILINGHVTPN